VHSSFFSCSSVLKEQGKVEKTLGQGKARKLWEKARKLWDKVSQEQEAEAY
jgi:hypothetical protein